MLADDVVRRWVDEIQAEYGALDAATLAEFVEAVRGDVVEWRWADAGSYPHRPDPWWRERDDHGTGEDAGWCDDDRPGPNGRFADRVGFDGIGRPLLVERHIGEHVETLEAWEHGDTRSVLRRFDNGRYGGDPMPTIVFYDALVRPSVVAIAEVVGHAADLPRLGVRVERWQWDGDIATEGAVEFVGPSGSTGEAATYRAERAEDGAVAVLWLEDRALWMAPRQLRPSAELVPLLTDGLAAALLAGTLASGIEQPWVIEQRGGADRDGNHGHLPGFARVGGDDFRQAMRASTAEDGAALDRLFTGVGRGAAMFDVIDFCDQETQRACGELNAAMAISHDLKDPETVRAYEVAEAVADAVTERLNAPRAVRGSAQPFGALIEAGARFGAGSGLTRATRVLGPAWAETFHAAMRSTVGATDGALVPEAFHDRAALAAALTARGIADAADVVAARAAPGYCLMPSKPGGLLSRRERPKVVALLHGKGLLPPGQVWPSTGSGRPLAFLAGVDLGAIRPEIEGGPVLPEAGWMLFFADLDVPDPAFDVEEPDWDAMAANEGSFYGEPTPNAEGASARMLWVPPGVDPLPATTPALRDGKHAPKEQRLVAVHQLTLEHGYDSGDDLGQGPAAAAAYSEIAEALNSGGTPEDAAFARDWVLGNVTGVQGHPLDEGTVLLLHLGSIEFQDGGVIQFRIPSGELERQDWSAVYAIADSC